MFSKQKVGSKSIYYIFTVPIASKRKDDIYVRVYLLGVRILKLKRQYTIQDPELQILLDAYKRKYRFYKLLQFLTLGMIKKFIKQKSKYKNKCREVLHRCILVSNALLVRIRGLSPVEQEIFDVFVRFESEKAPPHISVLAKYN